MVKKEANLVPLRRVCALVQLMEKSPETRIADTSGEIQKMRLQACYFALSVCKTLFMLIIRFYKWTSASGNPTQLASCCRFAISS